MNDMKKQTEKKNERPFILPDKVIEILARIRSVFSSSFRSLDSYFHHFEYIIGVPRISYTSIFRSTSVPQIIYPCASVFIGLEYLQNYNQITTGPQQIVE
jgi:hypothetical protein